MLADSGLVSLLLPTETSFKACEFLSEVAGACRSTATSVGFTCPDFHDGRRKEFRHCRPEVRVLEGQPNRGLTPLALQACSYSRKQTTARLLIMQRLHPFLLLRPLSECQGQTLLATRSLGARSPQESAWDHGRVAEFTVDVFTVFFRPDDVLVQSSELGELSPA